MKPNLFNYATSELSQDAFLCWLLNWAKDSKSEYDKDLNSVAQKFVDNLIGEDLLNYDIIIDRQFKNIDVCATVNDKYFVVIEDKKATSEHSNQLDRYAKYAKENKELAHLEVILVYFKMEEQSNLSVVKDAKFSHFNRDKMLMVLETYFSSVSEGLQNHILQDYHQNLLDLDNDIKSFRHRPLNEWSPKSWMGFYQMLQDEFSQYKPEWSYVSNASGGFWGFYWNHVSPSANTPTYYLQIQDTGLLTFRMKADDVEINKKYRTNFINLLKKNAVENSVALSKYGGKGKLGKTMGVLKLDGHFIRTKEDDTFDLDATIMLLKKITQIMTNSIPSEF